MSGVTDTIQIETREQQANHIMATTQQAAKYRQLMLISDFNIMQKKESIILQIFNQPKHINAKSASQADWVLLLRKRLFVRSFCICIIL